MPTLRVSRNCTQTLYEFAHYIWAERKNNRDEMDPKQQPRKACDHFMDCLRYIYNADPRYVQDEEDDEDEIVYEGQYTKHPTRKRSGTSSYHNLVDGKAGRF